MLSSSQVNVLVGICMSGLYACVYVCVPQARIWSTLSLTARRKLRYPNVSASVTSARACAPFVAFLHDVLFSAPKSILRTRQQVYCDTLSTCSHARTHIYISAHLRDVLLLAKTSILRRACHIRLCIHAHTPAEGALLGANKQTRPGLLLPKRSRGKRRLSDGMIW